MQFLRQTFAFGSGTEKQVKQMLDGRIRAKKEPNFSYDDSKKSIYVE